jgi:hypothetical protein
LGELRNSGFNMDQISIIGNNVDRNSDMAGAQKGEHLSNSKFKMVTSNT